MENLYNMNSWEIVVLMLWILAWKGCALWLSARANHKWWFAALMVLNTFAILDIIYVFAIAKKKPRDFFQIFKRKI